MVLTGKAASACALLEAAMREYEEVVGLRHPAVLTAVRRVEKLLESMPASEREKVRSLSFLNIPKELCLGLNAAVESKFPFICPRSAMMLSCV